MDHPHVASLEAYVSGVLAGEVLACKWIRLACERHRRDREAKASYPYRFDAARAERACKFAELFPHVKGRWAANHENLRLEPWQCFFYGSIFGWVHKKTGLRRFRKVRLYVPRKNGKAVSVETPVLTTAGWKRHGDLRFGDYVFAPDGLPVMVEVAGDYQLGPCREMVFSGGDRIIAHDQHEWVTDRTWYTGRKHVGYRWGQKQGPLPPVESQRIAETLRGGARGDFVHRVENCLPLQMPEADLPIPPYTMGAWLGDGSSGTAQITSADSEVIAGIEADGFPCRKLSGQYLYGFGDGSGDFIGALRGMGVLGAKGVPEIYLLGSVSQREALLQGLIDTDGTVSKAGQVTFCNTNRGLSEAVMQLVRSLGMKAQWTEKRAMLAGKDCGPRFDVQFWANEGVKVARLPRKAVRVKHSTGRATRQTIVSAESIGQHEVNCVQVEGGVYLVGHGLTPTHNSLAVAPIGLFMLTADGEPGAEVYSGATSEKQAWEVFGPAREMTKRVPNFVSAFGVEVNAKSLTRPGELAKFEPVIGKPGDGASPHCSITDEYHEHATDEQLATMETGMGAREQPLSIVVSTAGDNVAGPCRDDWLDCQKVLEGVNDDDRLFAMIFTIDQEDEWSTEAALRKANPNFDISVSGEFLLAQLRDAINNPRKQGHFKTKHLNLWVQARDAFINMQRWAECKRELRLEDFKGRRCFVGMDLASKIDLTAIELLFPNDDGTFARFGRYYLPEETVLLPENQHYQGWHQDGWLTATDGNQTDYFHVLDDIKQMALDFEIQQFAFDPHNATMLVTACQEEGLPMMSFGPTVLNFSEPMKQIEALIKDRKLLHNGDPVMNWSMSNVTAKLDRKDNVFPNKERSENKIDPFVALCMAMGVAMQAAEKQPSYDIHFI